MNRVRQGKALSRIRPEEMRVFVALGEARTLTEAAVSLDLPLHAVSRALKHIETAAQTILVRRGGQGIQLTTLGREYLAACRDVVHAHEQAADVLVAHHKEPEGTLQIGAPVNFARFVLAEVLRDFHKLFPKLDVEVSLYCADWNQELKVKHDVFVKIMLPNESRSHFKSFPAVRQGVFASPEYVAKFGSPQHPLELEKLDCVGYSLAHPWHFTQRGEHATAAPRLKVIMPDPEMLCRLSMNSVGVAILPLWMADREAQEGRLVPLLEDWALAPVTFCALYRGRLQAGSKEGAVLSFLGSILGTARDPRCHGEDPSRFFVRR